MNELQTKTKKSVASKALVTLDPEQYATAVFEPFKARIEAAIGKFAGVTYDIKSKEGMDIAKEGRATFRDIRIESDKERTLRKEPLITAGKLLQSKYVEIAEAVQPHEEKYDVAIKAEEDRIQAEKDAKIKAEAEAKAAIQNKIDAIKNKPIDLINSTIADIESEIEALSPLVATKEEYGERYVEVEYLLKLTVDTLNNMLSGKKAQEELAQQQAQAAEQAVNLAKEQSRIASIKAKIQSIKNLIIDGSEKDTSAEIKPIIQKLKEVVISEIEYQEFYKEAFDAYAKTSSVLHRQMDMLINSESASNAKVEEEEEQKAILSLATAEMNAILEEIGLKNEPEPEVLRTAVVEYQDEVSSFLASRDFGKDHHKIRAILVEFIKHQESCKLKIAA